jgi:two-component system, NtrC family, response regulator AtoC
LSETRRMLLVEDDLLLARPLARLLRHAGYDTLHVATCAAARAVGSKFDLAVLDVELPDGRGTDLEMELMALGIVPAAVFFTGEGTLLLAEAKQRARCVEKSEDIEALLRAISATLTESSFAAEEAPQSELRPKKQI